MVWVDMTEMTVVVGGRKPEELKSLERFTEMGHWNWQRAHLGDMVETIGLTITILASKEGLETDTLSGDMTGHREEVIT